MNSHIDPESVRTIRADVEVVLKDSEEATLALGSNLNGIVGSAEEFVEQLQNRVGAFGATGEGSISHTLDQQSNATNRFVEDLGRVIHENSTIADRVIESTGSVSHAAESVAAVADQARMLCFNTKIEAGRLGDLGRPFMVIADQMRELSEAIADSNEHISQLANDLIPLLSEVKSNVTSLEGRTESFTDSYGEHREQIKAISQNLQTNTADIMRTGDEKLADIIGRSHTSLMALQTQDLISQRLRKISSVVGRLCPESLSAEEGEAMEDIGLLSDGLSAGGDLLSAGDMELF